MFRKLISNIPNSITCLNLVCGVTACIFSFRFSEMIGGLYGMEWVWIFIGAAAIFDFCDGAAARALHAYSDLGKQLDSLSDLVSFGVAPSLLMFNLIGYYNGGWEWWSFTTLMIAVCGALRLAKFNIDDSQHDTFRGLPIPANAIFWIGFSAWSTMNVYPGNWVTVAFIVFIALMMISPMRMFSLKFTSWGIEVNLRRYIILAAAVIFFFTTGIAGFAWTIILYIIMSAFGSKSPDSRKQIK